MERRIFLRIFGVATLLPGVLTGTVRAMGLSVPAAAAGVVPVAPAPWASFLSIALHTENPPIGELQSYGEARYAGYLRVLVPRTSDRWAIALDDNGEPWARSIKDIVFPRSQQQTSETIGYFSVALAEDGKVLYGGPLKRAAVISADAQLSLSINIESEGEKADDNLG